MTKATASYDVIDALVDQLPSVSDGVRVSDGFGVSDDPGDFIMIGVDDLLSDRAAHALEADQEWAHVNHTTRHEAGDINCIAWSRVGDSDAGSSKRVRDQLRAVLDSLADYIRTNYTLGVPEVLWVGFRLISTDQDQDDYGAWCLANFQIHFEARI